MNSSIYYRNLIQTVLSLSESKDWDAAVDEWYLHDCEEDENREESCVCGKENLRYLFTIRNDINGHTLYPIGSSCIRKFGRADLSDEVSTKEQLFKLLHAIEKTSLSLFLQITSLESY